MVLVIAARGRGAGRQGAVVNDDGIEEVGEGLIEGDALDGRLAAGVRVDGAAVAVALAPDWNTETGKKSLPWVAASGGLRPPSPRSDRSTMGAIPRLCRRMIFLRRDFSH